MVNKTSALILFIVNMALRLFIEKTPQAVGSYTMVGFISYGFGYTIFLPLIFIIIGSFFKNNRNKKQLLKLIIIALCLTFIINLKDFYELYLSAGRL